MIRGKSQLDLLFMQSKLLRMLLLLIMFSLPTVVIAEDPAAVTKEDILKMHENDLFIGDPKAKVKVYEYSSLSCPHCAEYREKVLPEIKKNYIDTGKIVYIIREFPTTLPALKGAMLENCVPKDKRQRFSEALMKYQDIWAFDANNYLKSLENFASLAGMSKEDFTKCMENSEEEKRIIANAILAMKTLNIDGTPTIFVQNEMYKGTLQYDPMKTFIEAMIEKSEKSQ